MLYIFNQQAPALRKLFWTSILLRVSYNTFKALCKTNSPGVHMKKSICRTSTWIPKLTSWVIKQNRRTPHTWLTKELFTNSRARLVAFLRRLMNSFLLWKAGNKFQRYKGEWRDMPAHPFSCTAPARHQAMGSLGGSVPALQAHQWRSPPSLSVLSHWESSNTLSEWIK